MFVYIEGILSLKGSTCPIFKPNPYHLPRSAGEVGVVVRSGGVGDHVWWTRYSHASVWVNDGDGVASSLRCSLLLLHMGWRWVYGHRVASMEVRRIGRRCSGRLDLVL